MLNATALKSHMESKRHKKRQKGSEDEPKPICLAEDVLEDESVRTLRFNVHGLPTEQTCADVVPLSVTCGCCDMAKLCTA